METYRSTSPAADWLTSSPAGPSETLVAFVMSAQVERSEIPSNNVRLERVLAVESFAGIAFVRVV